jgi:ubiquinone biosynthesis protein
MEGSRRRPTLGGAGLSRSRLVFRAVTIVTLLLQQTLRWWVGWLWLLLTFAGRARRRAWFGQVVLDLFRSLGATFIKVGQIMSTRPDLIPEHITCALEKLQDDVGPFPYSAVARTIEEDLGRPVGAIFVEFAPVPIASASVAQVHKARLPDGKVVAVKVRRPEVVELCTFDLAVMRLFARLLSRLPALRPLEPEAVVEEFGNAVSAQLDFRIEARNNSRFRENFRDQPDVVFPEVLEQLSSARILCMTFIDGTKILGVSRTWSDPKRVARIGLQTLLKMIFEDGFVHADLHPGNIFITPDNRIALIDVGLVGELEPPHRRAFARFFAAWAQRDGETMARLMYSMSSASQSSASLRDQSGFERFRASIIEFVGRYWGQRMGEVQVGMVLFDMLTILRRHRIRMNPAFTIVNIAITVTEGIGKQLDPDLDLMSEALPYFLAHPIEAEEPPAAPPKAEIG